MTFSSPCMGNILDMFTQGSSSITIYNPPWAQKRTERNWQCPAQICVCSETKEQCSSYLFLEAKQYATPPFLYSVRYIIPILFLSKHFVRAFFFSVDPGAFICGSTLLSSLHCNPYNGNCNFISTYITTLCYSMLFKKKKKI